jgi:RNA polymerase sigma factor for flagellar operon FliA
MKSSAHRSYAVAVNEAPPAVPADLDEAVRANLPLVRRVVRRLVALKPPQVEMDEMVSWGLEGLLDALRRFDAGRQPSFEAYAQVRIRGTILDRLRELSWMSRGVRQRAVELERTYRKLERVLGRPATEDEVAAELEIDLGELHALLAEVGRGSMTALEDLKMEPSAAPVAVEEILDGESTDPVQALLSRERVELVAEAVARLPDKERAVIALYYHEGITMREVGAVLEVTESRVSQLHSQALLRLGGFLSEHFGNAEER